MEITETKICRWVLGKIDPQQWFGLRIYCLFVRNGNTYAVRLRNLRSAPIVNLKVSISARLFDDDGSTDYWISKEFDIPRIDSFSSTDETIYRPLEGAHYGVDCLYSDIEGNEFHETFYFDIDFEAFKAEFSSISWSDVAFYTQFGHKIRQSVRNPLKINNESDKKISEHDIIDMSSILVLGPDSSSQHIAKLKKIQEAISLLGYNSILVREQEELGHETLEQKLLRLALLTRFAIVEDSIAAGHIDELSLITRSRVTVAVLREHGKAGTWMQSDYDIDFPVKYFNYSSTIADDLSRAVSKSVDWAERKLRNRRELLGKLYPWR